MNECNFITVLIVMREWKRYFTLAGNLKIITSVAYEIAS